MRQPRSGEAGENPKQPLPVRLADLFGDVPLMLGGEQLELRQAASPARSDAARAIAVGLDCTRLTSLRCSRLSSRCTSRARSMPSRCATAIWLRPGVGADHRHHRILRRLDIDFRERLDEILENPELESPHRVTGMSRQRVEADRRRPSSARRAGLFAVSLLRTAIRNSQGWTAGLDICFLRRSRSL